MPLVIISINLLRLTVSRIGCYNQLTWQAKTNIYHKDIKTLHLALFQRNGKWKIQRELTHQTMLH